MRPNRCLHCHLNEEIKRWAREYGGREDGMVRLDVPEIIFRLCEVVGEFVYRADGRIPEFEKFARDSLSASFHYEATGENTSVAIERKVPH